MDVHRGLRSSDCANVPGTYPTITAAEAAAVSGDTIMVAAGSYSENISTVKQLIFKGAQAGVDARGRVASETIWSPATPSAGTLVLSASMTGTVVDGFTFTGGTSLGVIQTQLGAVYTNLQILNNRFSGYSGAAVFLQKAGLNIDIDKNVMDGSNIASSGQAIYASGSGSYGGLYITNNWIINNKGRYGFFSDTSHAVGESGTRHRPSAETCLTTTIRA